LSSEFLLEFGKLILLSSGLLKTGDTFRASVVFDLVISRTELLSIGVLLKAVNGCGKCKCEEISTILYAMRLLRGLAKSGAVVLLKTSLGFFGDGFKYLQA